MTKYQTRVKTKINPNKNVTFISQDKILCTWHSLWFSQGEKNYNGCNHTNSLGGEKPRLNLIQGLCTLEESSHAMGFASNPSLFNVVTQESFLFVFEVWWLNFKKLKFSKCPIILLSIVGCLGYWQESPHSANFFTRTRKTVLLCSLIAFQFQLMAAEPGSGSGNFSRAKGDEGCCSLQTPLASNPPPS